MNSVLEAITFCRSGLAQFAGHADGLALSMFLAGLGGSAAHCVGMCGPFVLGQVVTDAAHLPAEGYGEWQRLRGGALVPYHLGRVTTYSLLGAVAGAATATFASTQSFAWISGLLLAFGAMMMLAQAFGLAIGISLPVANVLTQVTKPLSSSRRPEARYALGVALGFLPCGLIYGALGVAAGTGAAWQGGIAMAAFSIGTVPALIAIGWGGALLRRRWHGLGRWIAAPLLSINAVLLLALASARLNP